MYNMIFGTNPLSDVILATLGLRRSDTGRFRDCFIANGEIAVYTRNGGGNRGCWHVTDPKWGDSDCKGEDYSVEVDEIVQVTEEEAQEKGYTLLNIYRIGSNKRDAKTGKRVMEVRHTCAQPESAFCACPGCIINHRLPKHPCYLRDSDDEFDRTYATIYFKFPDEFAEQLRKLDSGEKFDPDKRWLDAIEALKA